MSKTEILPDGIIIPSSTDYLAKVDRHLEEKFTQAGIDPSIITDIAISVSELVNNAIMHGNGSDISKTVEVKFSITSNELRVIITDQGEGFDIETVDNPVDDENLLKEIGRGIFIVKNFVDDLIVSQAQTGGTQVEIVKKL
ncbi:MAG: ATP-binding protein [candidate division Zixibacteria bacterium]